METVFRISNCPVENQVKFSTCTLLAGALTWWNSHVMTVSHDAAYAMTWADLRKKMTDKYCPRNEMKKLEAELWNLKVKGTDVIGYNQRFQELALLCVRMFPEESDKIERYVGGLPDMIHGNIVASKRVKSRERELHTTTISITSYPLKIQQNLSHFIINNHSFIMSTPVNTSSTDSQMHNNIMAAGSKDRPPMLGPGRYSQWRSRFLRYIDTKNNGEGLKKCILNGPYVPTSVLIQAVPAAEGRPAVQQHTAIETVLNMTPENKEHFQSEKEAIFLLLTGIGDEIYSTVDACNTANEMWIAIERLQQGESLNVQDVKTNLFWEFRKFTSRDGESMESYYSRFYKLMNELTRNNLQVTIMQVNVQFLQQLQPEWSRFVTLVKQSEKIDTISYHRLFDILKQFQKEVNDIRAERIAKSLVPQGQKASDYETNTPQSESVSKKNMILNKLRGT
ncbi:hypothetical protein Tco_0882157 [Tanacetum coccineum]